MCSLQEIFIPPPCAGVLQASLHIQEILFCRYIPICQGVCRSADYLYKKSIGCRGDIHTPHPVLRYWRHPSILRRSHISEIQEEFADLQTIHIRMYRLQRRYSHPHPVLLCWRHPCTFRRYFPADIFQPQKEFADLLTIYIRNV